jgi:hypothetical protein
MAVSCSVSDGCHLIDEIRDLFDELASISKSLADWDGMNPSAEQLEERISAAEVRVSSVGRCVYSLGDRAGRRRPFKTASRGRPWPPRA